MVGEKSTLKRVATIVMVCGLSQVIADDGYSQGLTGLAPVTNEMLEQPADDDWLMWRRTQNGWGYSPLDQVDRENVR